MEDIMDEFAIQMRKKRLLIIGVVVLTVILVAVCVLLALSGDRTPTPQQPTAQPTTKPTEGLEATIEELVLQEMAEQGNRIVVTTNFCTVSYPVAFEALMTAEAHNQGSFATLEFYATIDGQKCALFALVFNSQEGIPVGYLRMGEQVYAVNVIFHEPVGLSEDGKTTFYAAQETFNDVVTSLEDNAGFLTEKP